MQPPSLTEYDWPFPDGPRTCPHCGTPTAVITIPVLLSVGLSPKGGGKPFWTEVQRRWCRPCADAAWARDDEDIRTGNTYDAREVFAALRERREPRTQRELHPDQYPRPER